MDAIWRAGRKGASLVVVASLGKELFVASAIQFGVASDQKVDLRLKTLRTDDRATEIEELLRAIAPRLDVTSLNEEELTTLAASTATEVDELRAFVAASRDLGQSKLPRSALFLLHYGQAYERAGAVDVCALALFREALRAHSDKEGLSKVALEELVERWQNTPSFAPKLARAAIETAPDQKTGSSRVRLFLEKHTNERAFYDRLGSEQGEAAKREVEALVGLVELAENDWSIAKKLRVRSAHSRDVASLTLRELTELLREAEDAEERAAKLSSRAARSYPTNALVARIRRGEGALGASGLRKWFDAAELDDLATATQLPDEVRPIQRLFRVTPSFEQIDYLYSSGFLGAESISRQPRAIFMRAHSRGLGGDRAAAETFDRATTLMGLASALLVRNAEDFQGPAIRVTEPDVPVEIGEPLPGANPFDNHGRCMCCDCLSVFSPGAYLFDLLTYLRRDQTGTLFDALRVRRPELTSLQLSCRNTDELVPQLDLVNELLESTIATAAGRPVVLVHETAGSIKERRAHPQRIVESVYTTELLSARYPFALPFDLAVEEMRAYLSAFQTTRLAVMEATARSPEAAVRSTAIAHEHLGLSSAEAARITAAGHSNADWDVSPFVALPTDLATLVRRTQRELDDLLEVLECRFVSGSDSSIAISNRDRCVPADMIAALDTTQLIRLHRFLRLQRVLALSPHTLDRVLVALGAIERSGQSIRPVSDAFLLRLSHAKRIAEELDLDLVTVSSWFASRRDTHLYGLTGATHNVAGAHALHFVANTTAHVATPPLPVRSAFTLAMELTIDQLGGLLPISVQSSGNASLSWSLSVTNNGLLRASVGEATSIVDTAQQVMLAGRPTRIALRYAGDAPAGERVRIFVNGAEEARVSNGVVVPVELPAGAIHRLGDPQKSFDGSMRWFAFFDHALSLADITRLHEEPAPARHACELHVAQLFIFDEGVPATFPSIPDRSGQRRDGNAIAMLRGYFRPSAGTIRQYATTAALNTQSKLAPYYELFFDRSESSGDAPRFPLDPASFATPRSTIGAQRVRIASLLGIATNELEALVNIAFRDSAARVSLSHENLTILAAHAELSRALSLSVVQYRILLTCAGRNVFATPFDTLMVIAAAREIEASGLSYTELEELTLSSNAPSGAPRDQRRRATVLDLLETIHKAPVAIGSDIVLRDKLAAVLALDVETTAYLLSATWQPGQENVATAQDAFRQLIQLPASPRPNDNDLLPAIATLARLEKVARLCTHFVLDVIEVRWLFETVSTSALRALPIAPATEIQAAGIFAELHVLLRVKKLRRYFVRSEGRFADVLLQSGVLAEGAFLDLLFERTNWPRAGGEAARATLGLAYPADFRGERGLEAFARLASLSAQLGVSMSMALDWGGAARPSIPDGIAVKQAARAARGDETWFDLAKKIRDPLRRKQRDALVAYLLANPPAWAAGRPWNTRFDLFEALLADVDVDTAVETSRIVFAHGTLQTFIQRILMNLELGLSIDSSVAKEWEWRRNYRVWEVARRVFVYPENWILPELKPKKTALFEALEAALQDGDFDPRAAESAARQYIEGLESIAGLEVISSFHERHVPPPDGFPQTGIIHIIARTRSKPQQYYYCRRIEDRVSAWEHIDFDIESDQVAAAMLRGRLFLFWTRLRVGEVIDATPPHRHVTAVMLVAEYREGKWIRGRVSAEEELRAADIELLWNVATTRLVARPGLDHVELDLYFQKNLGTGPYFNHCLRTFHYSPVNGAFRVVRGAALEEIPFQGVFGLWDAQILSTDRAELSSSGVPVPLFQNPGAFRLGFESSRLVAPDANPQNPAGKIACHPFAGDTFFVHDDRNTFVVRPEEASGNQGYADFLYHFDLISHPQIRRLREIESQRGIFAVYDLDLQRNPASEGPLVDFAAYGASALVARQPDEQLIFSELSPFGEYNWELFFYAPLAIASRLRRSQRFEMAQKWMHLVFDPTVGGASASRERFWRFLPLNAIIANPGDNDLLAILTARGTNALSAGQRAHLQAQLDTWLEDPFSPHAIARMRLSAYQRAVFMQYLDLLIEWADERFQRNDRESMQEAVQLYILAAQLLGPREAIIGRCDESASAGSFDELTGRGVNRFPNALEDRLSTLPRGSGPGLRASPEVARMFDILRSRGAFCVPPNERLLRYWDIIEDRLYKIRHALNFAGAHDPLPLFAPPIDPALLVRARAQGLLLDEVIGNRPRIALDRRFDTLLRFALDLVGNARNYGTLLASALERRDGELLAELRLEQEVELAKSARLTRSEGLKEAKAQLRSMSSAIEQARARHAYYARRPLMNDAEKRELDLMDSARGMESSAAVVSLVARVLYLVPELSAEFPPSVSFGGLHLGSSAEMVADGMRDRAAGHRHTAARTGRQGSFEQRADDNKLQAELARHDIERLERDLTAAEIRSAIAEHELKLHDQDLELRKEMMEELRAKFTNRELYQWMSSQASRMYFQSFDLALDLARAAEAVYRFDTQDDAATYVDAGYWDGFRKGLFAAERLEHDLRRMQVDYLRNTPREYRVVKHISLAQVAPDALLALRTDGDARFLLLEELFDCDFPGHHFRRIRRVGVTIPVVAGPYASVNATLTLEESWLRSSADPAASLIHQTGPESIVTSSAENDAMDHGQNEREERRAPFEGRGVISRWRLEMDREPASFALSSIPDVILSVTYSSRPGNDALRTAAEGRLANALPGVEAVIAAGVPSTPSVAVGARPIGRRLFSMRSHQPNAWLHFLDGNGTADTSLVVRLDNELFGTELRNAAIELHALMFVFVLPEGRIYEPPLLQSSIRAPGEPLAIATQLDAIAEVPVAIRQGLHARINDGPMELTINHSDLTALNPSDLLLLCTYDVR
jgi:hypothetical protein